MSPEVQRFTTALRLHPESLPGAIEHVGGWIELQQPERPAHEEDTSTWD